jgi:negative regulator of sigma E activity
MTHDRASELLLELTFGDLAPGVAREVEAHAAGCDACRAELAALRGTRAVMAKLPAEPAPDAGMGIVLAAARQAADARAAKKRTLLPPWLWAGSIGAAAAVIAVVSWQVARVARVAPPTALAPREQALLGEKPAPAPPPAAAEPPAPKGAVAALAEKELAAPAATGAVPPEPAAPVKDEAPRRIGIAAADRAEPRQERMAAPRAAPAPAPALRAAPPPAAAAPAGGGLGSSGAAANAAGPAPAPAAPQVASKAERAAELDGEAVPGFAAESRRLDAARPAQKKAASRAAAAAKPGGTPGSVEVRTFPGCPGERRRVVERGEDGAIVRYVREGETRTVEQHYGPGGALVAAFAIEGGVRRPLALSAPGLVTDASAATLDAPPRCAP